MLIKLDIAFAEI